MSAAVKIPLLDLKAQHQALRGELLAAAGRVLDSGAFILGPEVRAFEAEFAEFSGARYCAGLSSGTDALRIALEALGVGPGDEVAVPAFTFIATASVVSSLGARPIFVDVDSESLAMDPAHLARSVTPRTKAAIIVHLYGYPAEMEPLLAVANQAGFKVIEDCAQAHGALYRGRPVGTLGDAGAFSFYPTKNLGALGDAGCLTTRDRAVFERCSQLRDAGRAPGQRYLHERVGLNARLDELQAAFLRVKLRRMNAWNEARRNLAAAYRSALRGLPLKLPPEERHGTRHAYHLFVVRTPKRDALAEHLSRAGIATGVYYPLPLNRQPAFADLSQTEPLPQSERACREVLALPLYPEMEPQAVQHIASEVRLFFG